MIEADGEQLDLAAAPTCHLPTDRASSSGVTLYSSVHGRTKRNAYMTRARPLLCLSAPQQQPGLTLAPTTVRPLLLGGLPASSCHQHTRRPRPPPSTLQHTMLSGPSIHLLLPSHLSLRPPGPVPTWAPAPHHRVVEEGATAASCRGCCARSATGGGHSLVGAPTAEACRTTHSSCCSTHKYPNMGLCRVPAGCSPLHLQLPLATRSPVVAVTWQHLPPPAAAAAAAGQSLVLGG